MKETRYPYFAYGSNLDQGAMKFRCPDAVPAGPAELKNWRLTFRGVADIEPAQGRVVRGALWWVSKKDIKALDGYEGAPNFYEQRILEIVLADGTLREAMTYVMVDRRAYGEVGLPSPHYYETIARGYRDFGLKMGTLRKALRETQDEHREQGIISYRERGPKRMMAVIPRPRFDYDRAAWGDELDEAHEEPLPAELDADEEFFRGMSPATRRLWELDREASAAILERMAERAFA